MRAIGLSGILGLTLFLCGCPSMRGNKASIMPGNIIGGNNGYVDPAEESTDPWITEAAQEGRPDQQREASNEAPWFRNMMMSSKAQSIEANVGFD